MIIVSTWFMHLHGTKWLIGSAALFVAWVSGCSASDREPQEPGKLSKVADDGNADAQEDLDAGTGVSHMSADPGSPASLCDGSDDIRFAMTSSRNAFDDEALFVFAEPYGPSFIFLDGQCRYWIGLRGHLQGVRQGQLTEGLAAEFAQAVGIHRLAEWQSVGRVGGCLDGGSSVILDADHAVTCACSCAGIPGLESALGAAWKWHRRLWEDAEPLNEGLHIAARLDPYRMSSIPNPANLVFIEWPLPWSMTEVAEADGSVDPDGRRIEDLEEQQTLRELRAVSLDRNPSATAVPVIQDDQGYYVYIRDDLPTSIQRAINTFTRRER
jgi:hypothetical protein